MSNADRKSSIPPEPSNSTAGAIATLNDAMALACSSPAGFDDEPRALPIFDDVPPGCMIYQERSARHEPHIHAGEFVIVDLAARDIIFGELYLVLQSDGPIVWQVRRTRNNPDCVNLSPLCQPCELPDGSIDLSKPIFFSDGPLKIDFLKRDLLGRVVGLINPRDRADKIRAQAVLRNAERRI